MKAHSVPLFFDDDFRLDARTVTDHLHNHQVPVPACLQHHTEALALDRPI